MNIGDSVYSVLNGKIVKGILIKTYESEFIYGIVGYCDKEYKEKGWAEALPGHIYVDFTPFESYNLNRFISISVDKIYPKYLTCFIENLNYL